MTFPTYDPQAGLKLNAEGTDVEVIWPKQKLAWTAAVVKARLWLIKGQWKYDLREGLDLLGKVLGQVLDRRVMQELFRREISRDVDLTELRLRETEKGEVLLTWKGGANSEIEDTISIIEPPVIEAVEFSRYKLSAGGTLASLWFSEELFAQNLPKVANFELSRTGSPPPNLVSVSINGTHLYMIFDADATGTEVIYLPDEQPMRGVSQVLVTPFRVVLT